jgi:hypothetical protein
MTARIASSFVPAALLALSAFVGVAVHAQAIPALPAPDAAATQAQATDKNGAPLVETASATRSKDPKIEHLVTEDSQVRIDELRVRGVTKKIVVHSKIPGMGSYEIQPRDPSIDPENDHGAGMRLFNFGF